MFSSWLRNRERPATAAGRHARSSPPRSAGRRPRLEGLEGRTLLTTYTASSVSALIADINAANMTGGSNTIILASGTTFDLKSANNNTTNGANGLPVIGGTKAGGLTIVGNGDTVERVGGVTYNKRGVPSNPFRLFDVAPGASLTLQSVRLQGGWAYGSVGGAIYNQDTLTLGNSTVSTMTGGGIYNGGGTVTVSSSTLTNISGATYGGAISNVGGTVTVSGSTLSLNNAVYGGGIYNSRGTVTVSNSTLSGNSATYGGGIYNSGGTLTVSNNSTLSGNSATPDYSYRGGEGGGIDNGGGTVTMSNSTLSGNSAHVYGGIYNDAAGTMTVKNSSSITGNTIDGGDAGPIAQDVYNLGLLYLDSTSTIGVLDGNPAHRI